jgi:hypothetical protein
MPGEQRGGVIMVKCDRYENLLMRQFDHELSDDEREVLNGHLHSCPSCLLLSSDLTGILNPLETATPLEPPPDLERAVLSLVESLGVVPVGNSSGPTKVVCGSLAGLLAVLCLLVGPQVLDIGLLELVAAGTRYLDWFSSILLNLQIAYQIVASLFLPAMSFVIRDIQILSVLFMLLVFVGAIRATVGERAGRNRLAR